MLYKHCKTWMDKDHSKILRIFYSMSLQVQSYVNNLEQCHIQFFNNKKKTHTPTTPWRSQPSVRPCLRPPRCNTPLHDALLCLSIVLATKTYTCRSLDMGNSATIVLPICNIYFNICNNIYFCRFHVLSRTLTIMQYSDFHIIWTNSAHYLLRNL